MTGNDNTSGYTSIEQHEYEVVVPVRGQHKGISKMKISQKRKNTRSNWFDAMARVSEKRKNYVKTDFQFNSDVEFYASHLMRRNEKVAHKNPTHWNRRVVEIVLICVSIVNVPNQPVMVVKRLPLLTPSLGRYRVPFYCVHSIYRAAWPFLCVCAADSREDRVMSIRVILLI